MHPPMTPSGIFHMHAMRTLWEISNGVDYCYALARTFESDKSKTSPSHTNLVRSYLIVQYLKKRNFIEQRKEHETSGRTKKSYQVTKKGFEELGSYKREIKESFGDYLTYILE
jgi:DNA-binding PadR family transcriptional regulator